LNPAEHRSFVQRLIEQPYDEATLRFVYEATGTNPDAYAGLLVVAAERTSEHVAASHWLTEAARVKLLSLGDERASARLLEGALERDPLNLRAAEHLVELLRARTEDRDIADVVRKRAAALRESYAHAGLEGAEAALAFEHLSGVYEALGDSGAAIAALRTALELERRGSRRTAPSPPPDAPPESWLRTQGSASERIAPPPERPFTVTPSSDERDTYRSPVPVPGLKEPPEPASAPGRSGSPAPEVPPSARAPRSTRSAPGNAPRAPLLSVVEALHALRRVDDVVEGAALVLKTALDAIPSTAGIVHVADVATRDFVVVAASGARSADVIGTRTSETDPILDRAHRALEAITVSAEGRAPFTGARFRAMPPGRGVLCAPVHFDGRVLGAIELIDASPGPLFGDGDRHAMTYLGERFAEFLADRSLAF
jgi:tetratricopeptide (TPR) repeat protein